MIENLIEENTKTIEKIREVGITTSTPWNQTDIIDLSLPDIATLVSVVPISIVETTVIPIQEQIPEVIPEPFELPEFTPPELIPTEILPPTVKLPKADEKKLRTFKLRLYMGPKERYRVKYSYPKGKGETVTVDARGFPDAVQKAQRIRKTSKYLPNVIDVTRI
jgi:hypothetical protein